MFCLVNVVRSYSNKLFNPEQLALEYSNKGGVITASQINKILSNQKVSITEVKLKDLLKIDGVEFNLPITKTTEIAFNSLVGKSKHKGFAGVYVFIHIKTGSMYVGSSNLLNLGWVIILKMIYLKWGNYYLLLKRTV